MPTVGFFLSSEEHPPQRLVEFAQKAEVAGFRDVLISDHFHPWTERQGESSFVWSVIGAIAGSTRLHVTTGVTCPTIRIHPAIVAQAAATSALLLDGRFALGVGTGEALNEHILGDKWPPTDTRLEMLEEAIGVIRELWDNGVVTHHGRHYSVENARIFSKPDQPPPMFVSGFGAKSIELAARLGDGFVTTAPAGDAIREFREHGGVGPAVVAAKVCWGEDERAARRLAFDVWKVTSVPAELNQELPMPAHFEQAATHVTEDMVAEKITCGPDPEHHAEAIQQFLTAGFDRVYVSQIGPDQQSYLDFFFKEVHPRLSL